MTVRIVIGVIATVVAFGLAGRRLWWLYRLIRAGQPATDRAGRRSAGAASGAAHASTVKGTRAEVTEVIGQRKLLAWTVPGLAHAFTFWAFLVLGLTIVEAYGALFKADFGLGHWAALGFF